MNNLQKQAIKKIERFAEEQIEHFKETYGAAVVNFKVVDAHAYYLVHFETDLLDLPFGNLLRALDHDYWTMQVGKRGAITVTYGSDSCEQFAGKRAFGMNWSTNYNGKKSLAAYKAKKAAEA